jgi:hypothetical protein
MSPSQHFATFERYIALLLARAQGIQIERQNFRHDNVLVTHVTLMMDGDRLVIAFHLVGFSPSLRLPSSEFLHQSPTGWVQN